MNGIISGIEGARERPRRLRKPKMRAADADLDFKIRILKNAPLFRHAADDDIAELARVGKVVAVERGKTLSKRGREGTLIFVVQSGVGAELHLELGEDRPILVKLHGPGAVAGLVDALMREDARPDPLEDEPHGRRIEALTNMSVLVAPAADFLRLCRRDADLSAALARLLAEHNEVLAQIFARSTHHTLEMRLAAFFARITELTAADNWNPAINLGKLSQSAIATMLGVSREQVNRTIAMWERSGLIFQNKSGDFLVHNAKRLAHLAQAHPERGTPDQQDDWLWEIDAHLDRGLNQTALHLALEAAKRAPKELRYCHRAVLATARLGAISEALHLVEKWKLDRDPANEELACLRPRLLRDLAFAQNPQSPHPGLLAESAKDYETVFTASRGFYPGVTAAEGYALHGDAAKAKAIASSVCNIIAETADEERDDYWRRTTLAECRLLMGEPAAAASLFEAASNAGDATPGKKATTRKQLRRLAKSVGVDAAWIDRAAPQPGVMFYSGPLARDASSAGEAPASRLADRLDDFLSARPIAWAYGALASGADIVIAEALLEAGIELNVYLPLPPGEFLKSSVDVAGPGWRERFIACMRAASGIEWLRRAPKASDSAYRLGASIAMGKAIRHAAQLETEAAGFFAVPNDADASQSLSLANAELWKARGLAAVVARDAWPTRTMEDSAAPADDALYYALVVQRTSGGASPDALAAARHVTSEDGGVDLFLFESLQGALAEAARFAGSPEAASSSLWLDAGVFSEAELARAPVEAANLLVTSACRPITEPGKIFASEPFACAAALAPSLAASFDYVGFAPTREKLDPCALYLVRF